MKGKILDFSIQSGKGTISADDENRYNFSVEEWRSDKSPEVNQIVDFEIDGKQAKGIYVQKEEGWSWMGFFFAPYYYAGYGKLKAGIIMAVLLGIMPLVGIIVGFYGGWHAKRELPIKEVEFDWKNVGLTVLVVLVVSNIFYYFINNT